MVFKFWSRLSVIEIIILINKNRNYSKLSRYFNVIGLEVLDKDGK